MVTVEWQFFSHITCSSSSLIESHLHTHLKIPKWPPKVILDLYNYFEFHYKIGPLEELIHTTVQNIYLTKLKTGPISPINTSLGKILSTSYALGMDFFFFGVFFFQMWLKKKNLIWQGVLTNWKLVNCKLISNCGAKYYT